MAALVWEVRESQAAPKVLVLPGHFHPSLSVTVLMDLGALGSLQLSLVLVLETLGVLDLLGLNLHLSPALVLMGRAILGALASLVSNLPALTTHGTLVLRVLGLPSSLGRVPMALEVPVVPAVPMVREFQALLRSDLEALATQELLQRLSLVLGQTNPMVLVVLTTQAFLEPLLVLGYLELQVPPPRNSPALVPMAQKFLVALVSLVP